jgi:hypothetical protein
MFKAAKYRFWPGADGAKGRPAVVLRALPVVVASIVLLCGCRGVPKGDFGNRARLMRLTSDPTEIVLSSAKVPGYWARQLSDEQEFFLSTPVRSFEKGRRVKVEGPFGFAYAAVFRDETGVYLSAVRSPGPTTIVVVWKMAAYEGQQSGQPPSRKADR